MRPEMHKSFDETIAGLPGHPEYRPTWDGRMFYNAAVEKDFIARCYRGNREKATQAYAA